jgi:putative nucleotidyltransferase with HDIG domain
LEQAVSLEKNIEKIIDSMPSLPITVAKIIEITKNPQSTPSDLNKVITLDPVLTAKVLKLVNSAYYSLSSQVTSIVKAIILLGINTIKNLSISTAVLGTINKKTKATALNMDGFWRHCLAVGVTARDIAAKMGVDPKLRDEYFIAGMLHDIGKIVLNEHFSERYLQTIHGADSARMALWKKELELFETNHAQTGRMVAEKWQLSPALIEAIGLHHSPAEATAENRRLVAAIAAADAFCIENAVGFSGNRIPDILPDLVWQTLGLKEEDLFGIEDTINDELERASVFLKISEKA